MKPINKIMAALDFSNHSHGTLKYAANLANCLGAKLIITNVVALQELNTMRTVLKKEADINVEKYLQRHKEKRSSKIQELLEQANCNNLLVKTVFRVGVPFVELIEAIKEESVDLVIMGSKTRRNVFNVLFGSTAEKVFHHSQVPVLSFRPWESDEMDSGISLRSFKIQKTNA